MVHVSIPIAVAILVVTVPVAVAVAVPISLLRDLITHNHSRTHDARKNFRLSNSQRGVKWKRHPQRHALGVRLAAGHQHAAARNIDGGAHFGFLAEGCRPAESRRQTELDAMMLAPVHSSPR